MVERAWDDPRWAVKSDSEWIAGCRWLQAWWRNQRGWPAGPRVPEDERLVATMLPEGCDDEAPFFNKATFQAVEEWLDEIGYGTTASRDRLFRNLLAIEALRFNLFGPFAQKPDELLPWVQTIDAAATSVDGVRFAWGPKKSKVIAGGTAYDAFVTYRAGESARFVAVACMYADDPAASKAKVTQAHLDATAATGAWRDGAARRLDIVECRQIWMQTLLAQQLVATGEYGAGIVVVLSHRADADASTATGLVRSELLDADQWLRWSAYETVVKSLEETASGKWLSWFRTRYLDFSPVAHLLDPGDPRASGARADNSGDEDGFKELVAVGKKVLGRGGVVNRIASGKLQLRDAHDAPALALRAAQLAKDLAAFQQTAHDAAE